MKLQGKVAVVTGGGTGIGRAIALAFAEEGADVAVNYSKSKSEAEEVAETIKAKGRKAVAIQADVSDAEQVDAMAEHVINEFGKVDILVNNAGILPGGALEDLPRERWLKTVAINLNGVFFCTQVFGKHMIRQKSGVIINISSTAGLIPLVYGGAYSATKAAVVILTRQTALEWAKHNIRANAICPGPVKTRLILDRYSPEVLEARNRAIPFGRPAEPEEVARLAVFLASDDAKYITGQAIAIDGGLTHSVYRLVRQVSGEERL